MCNIYSPKKLMEKTIEGYSWQYEKFWILAELDCLTQAFKLGLRQVRVRREARLFCSAAEKVR